MFKMNILCYYLSRDEAVKVWAKMYFIDFWSKSAEQVSGLFDQKSIKYILAHTLALSYSLKILHKMFLLNMGYLVNI